MSMDTHKQLLHPSVIQIAGVVDEAEAHMLATLGATHIGFPLRLPVNAPDTSEERAAEIIRALPDTAVPVLITYLDQANEIAEFCSELGCTAVQLHGAISPAELSRLRLIVPGLTVFKRLVVGEGEHDLAQLCVECAPHVDAFITDTFDPVTGASGATGKTHDWTISRRLVELSPKPVILAGGLMPENVAAGIVATGCAGVDSHTGVENADGRKDPEKVRAFVKAARAAFAGA